MRIVLLSAFVLINLFSCLENKKAEVNKELKNLETQVVINPKNQAEIDKNIILKYAAQNNLPLKSTTSGLFYMIERPGSGDFAKYQGRVACHYKGYFLDGKEFDSSLRNPRPTEFYVNEVVPAWIEALTTLLKPGGKIKLLVPSALGYGEVGYPGVIPGNSVLAFDLELIKIVQ